MSDNPLHITNGDVANQYFSSIGLIGEFLSWDDVLHIGPITNHANLERSSNLRAAYLANLGWGKLASIQSKFASRNQRFLEALDSSTREVIIWNSFELFDQLHLMQICHWLYVNAPNHSRIKIIFVDSYLGDESKLSSDWIKLVKHPTALSFEQVQLGYQCWQAYTQSTPAALVDIYLKQDLSSWPFLQQALERLILEIPNKRSGISRSETLILKSLRNKNLTLKQIFSFLGQNEPIRFIGDLAFLVIIDEMIHSEMPLVEAEDHGPFERNHSAHPSRDWSERYFSLTEAGNAVLTKRVDWLSQHAINRWWGGCHLTSINDWRWDAAANQVIEYSRHLKPRTPCTR